MFSAYEDLLVLEYFGNTVQDWAVAALTFIGIIAVLIIFKSVLLARMKKWAKKTRFTFDDGIVDFFDRIGIVVYGAIALYVSVQGLMLPNVVNLCLKGFFLIVVIGQAIRLVEAMIKHVLKSKFVNGQRDSSMSSALSLIIKVILWSTGLLLILSNLGFNINSLIASLGIGGIAISLALQNILGDLFSSFSIAFDKPFEEGDYIVVGEHMGTVKHIGLKTTRLTALQGEEVVISNAELTSARVQNFKKMQRRRVVFSVGVTYDTPAEKLKKIPSIVQNVIEGCGDVEFGRAHLFVMGDFSLNYEVVYFMTTNDYDIYMDRQQEINLGLIEAFEKEGIEFAFPTQTVIVQK